MSVLEPLFSRRTTPGVYRLVSRRGAAGLCAEIEANGWRCFIIDGDAVVDKPTFLHAVADVLGFPPYFGQNWDALADALADMTWARAAGYMLIYEHADQFATNEPAQWDMAREILVEACGYWATRGTPFYVLVRGAIAGDGIGVVENVQ